MKTTTAIICLTILIVTYLILSAQRPTPEVKYDYSTARCIPYDYSQAICKP